MKATNPYETWSSRRHEVLVDRGAHSEGSHSQAKMLEIRVHLRAHSSQCLPGQNNETWKYLINSSLNVRKNFHVCKKEYLTEGWVPGAWSLEPGAWRGKSKAPVLASRAPAPTWAGVPWPTGTSASMTRDLWVHRLRPSCYASKQDYEYILPSYLDFSLGRECIGQWIHSSLLVNYVSHYQLMSLLRTWLLEIGPFWPPHHWIRWQI